MYKVAILAKTCRDSQVMYEVSTVPRLFHTGREAGERWMILLLARSERCSMSRSRYGDWQILHATAIGQHNNRTIVFGVLTTLCVC